MKSRLILVFFVVVLVNLTACKVGEQVVEVHHYNTATPSAQATPTLAPTATPQPSTSVHVQHGDFVMIYYLGYPMGIYQIVVDVMEGATSGLMNEVISETAPPWFNGMTTNPCHGTLTWGARGGFVACENSYGTLQQVDGNLWLVSVTNNEITVQKYP